MGGDAIAWLADRAGDALLLVAAGQVVRANQAAAVLFATEQPAALVGCGWCDLVVDGAFPALAGDPAGWRAAIPCSGRLRRLSGEEFDAEVTAWPLALGAGQGGALVIHDLAAADRQQRQTLRAARLAIVGETAAALVHDLVQPLNVIRLGAEGALLLAERGGHDPETARQHFELIAGQCAEAAERIEALGRICRRDPGDEAVPFDALATARDAARLLRGHLFGHAIDLDLAGLDDGGGEAPVAGRRSAFEHLILALLLDADHACGRPRSGRGRIRLAARRNAGRLTLELTDTRPFAAGEDEDDGRSTRAAAAAVTVALGGTLTFTRGLAGGRVEISLPLLPAGPDLAARFAESHLLLVGGAAGALAVDLTGWGARVSRACVATAWTRFAADPADVVLLDGAEVGAADLVGLLRDFDPLLPILLLVRPGTLAAVAEDERCLLWRGPLVPAALRPVIGQLLSPPPPMIENGGRG